MQMSEQNLMPSTDLQKSILDKSRTAESKQVCRICKQTKWRTNRRTGTDFPHLTQTSRWSVQVQSSKTKLCCCFWFVLFFLSIGVMPCTTAGLDPIRTKKCCWTGILKPKYDKKTWISTNIEISITNKNRLGWSETTSLFFFFFKSITKRDDT